MAAETAQDHQERSQASLQPARAATSPRSVEEDDKPAREGRELLDAAAKVAEPKSKEKLSAEESVDALEWFLSDTDATDLLHTFEINVGSIAQKRWIAWTVKPVDMDKLRRIRRNSQQNSRRARLSGNNDFDEVQANVQITLEGTVHPDLRAAGRDIGAVDPGDAVKQRFAHKPGLLAQIAGEIMSISGYDDDDIREADAARG